MNIALDFDDTYTRDTKMWDTFIDMALTSGHDVRIVTFRKKSMRDPALDGLSLRIPVIFTEYQQKRPYCQQIGFDVDVWIDDSPEFIVSGQPYVWDRDWKPKHD